MSAVAPEVFHGSLLGPIDKLTGAAAAQHKKNQFLKQKYCIHI